MFRNTQDIWTMEQNKDPLATSYVQNSTVYTFVSIYVNHCMHILCNSMLHFFILFAGEVKWSPASPPPHELVAEGRFQPGIWWFCSSVSEALCFHCSPVCPLLLQAGKLFLQLGKAFLYCTALSRKTGFIKPQGGERPETDEQIRHRFDCGGSIVFSSQQFQDSGFCR